MIPMKGEQYNPTRSKNHRYETITGFMGLQDQIESFEMMVFAHLRYSSNNECRISSLTLVKVHAARSTIVRFPLRFTTVGLSTRTNDREALELLYKCFNA